ncbi:MAG: glycosyltransferase [Lachnospiraceae bacterium]|nr:glycosyltransferase [Lachnospiraceae bacterium]
MNESTTISVICITFDQKQYIEKSIESIFGQKADLSIEIIIHDDVSVDGTAEILIDYEKRYPDRIKLILETKNQHSQNIDFFSKIVRNHAKGKYIAICEGDDYWTDVNKLQVQFEALEAHPECDMCACRAVMVSEDGNHILGEIRPREGDGILQIEDVILGGGNYVATAGLFFRKSMFDHMMDFEKVRSLDYSHQMKGALRGGIYYIDKAMAAYRRYSKSSITNLITNDQNAMRHQCEQEKLILKTLDRETFGRYHEVIEKRLLDYEQSFYDQLVSRDSELSLLLNEIRGKRVFLWGTGQRGRDLEKYLSEKKFGIQGVCDITVLEGGAKTERGNVYYSCDDVLEKADVILASITGAYEYLQNNNFNGTAINMQEYMPRA